MLARNEAKARWSKRGGTVGLTVRVLCGNWVQNQPKGNDEQG